MNLIDGERRFGDDGSFIVPAAMMNTNTHFSFLHVVRGRALPATPVLAIEIALAFRRVRGYADWRSR